MRDCHSDHPPALYGLSPAWQTSEKERPERRAEWPRHSGRFLCHNHSETQRRGRGKWGGGRLTLRVPCGIIKNYEPRSRSGRCGYDRSSDRDGAVPGAADRGRLVDSRTPLVRKGRYGSVFQIYRPDRHSLLYVLQHAGDLRDPRRTALPLHQSAGAPAHYFLQPASGAGPGPALPGGVGAQGGISQCGHILQCCDHRVPGGDLSLWGGEPPGRDALLYGEHTALLDAGGLSPAPLWGRGRASDAGNHPEGDPIAVHPGDAGRAA